MPQFLEDRDLPEVTKRILALASTPDERWTGIQRLQTGFAKRHGGGNPYDGQSASIPDGFSAEFIERAKGLTPPEKWIIKCCTQAMVLNNASTHIRELLGHDPWGDTFHQENEFLKSHTSETLQHACQLLNRLWQSKPHQANLITLFIRQLDSILKAESPALPDGLEAYT
jgi:hypothetical protein